MAKKPASVPVLEEARKFMQTVIDAESENRVAALDDLRFSSGDQWPAPLKLQRQLQNRPFLTIDKTDTFVRSVVNNMRQQRPRIKVHPVSDGADVQTAQVIEGLTRHIEVSSNADVAYDTAADYQVRMGRGYWRVLTKYCDEQSFDQDLYIDRVRNPFSVYFDPSSTDPAGADAKKCAVTGKMPLEEFERKYPGKKSSSWTLTGPGDDTPRKDEVMLLEYLRLVEEPEDLVRLNTGEVKWAKDLPSEEQMKASGLIVIDRRKSMKTKLRWSLLSGAEELDSRDLPGKYMTVIPCDGAELIDQGKVIRFGMVRKLKDPQRQYNYLRTTETEVIALQPKAPFVMAEGQDEGFEEEWEAANNVNFSRLRYKVVAGPDGQTALPPPQRQPMAEVPAALVQAAMSASEDLKAVAGMFDPALGAPGQETSGTMVAKRQSQSDLSNFHFYDNLTRSIRQTGVVILDLIPSYYDTKRVVRIIGEDGTPDSVTLNEQAVDKVLNDMTVGRYDVVMDTGPGYNTKRLEALDAMMNFVKADPETLKVAADIIVRKIDAPGMDELAERLAMANPLAQIDKQLPKDMDPKAKQMVARLMGQLQQVQQQVQQLQQEKAAKVFGLQEREHAVTQREMLKEDEETRRLHLKEKYADEREERRLHADLAINDADNQTAIQTRHMQDATSVHETLIDAQTNLAIEHRRAMDRGIPDANNTTR